MSENNVVVLRGTLTGPASTRQLGSGEHVVQFDLKTVDDTGTSQVPVAWFDPDRAIPVDEGGEIVVLGRVRRRFYRTGGATQSRTEVVAERVVDGARRREVRKVIDRAVAALSGDG